MAWRLEFGRQALKDLDDLDAAVRARILRYLRERVAVLDNPRQLGSALQGKTYTGLWRYRIGDYRVLAHIKDGAVTILVVEVGHRRDIYK
jgi:mRNA interferase RelE/StbE